MKTGTDTSGYQALRRHRYSQAHHIYLITFATRQRERIFNENYRLSSQFCVALNDSRLWLDAKLLCWVLMPDHVHLLVQLGVHETLPKLMERLKSNTARALNRILKRKDAVWGKGYHDRAIRLEEDIVDVARYIVMNPIRAGLVNKIGQYPYWNAVWL